MIAIDTRVRMILEGYDNAPDGNGSFEKLNKVFATRKESMEFRQKYNLTGYDGRLETPDGALIESLLGE